jgi:hypothetical protein
MFFHPCNHIHSFPLASYAITAAKPSSPIMASQSLATTSFYSRVPDPAPPTASGPSTPSTPLTQPPPQPRRHPVPSPDQSMPCFTPPWCTTPLPIELPFTMPACFLLPYPHGVMPSMPDTFQHGLYSHPPLSAITLLNPFPCIKDISTKYELTFGRLAFPHPACNNQPLMLISKTTWRRRQRTTPVQE